MIARFWCTEKFLVHPRHVPETLIAIAWIMEQLKRELPCKHSGCLASKQLCQIHAAIDVRKPHGNSMLHSGQQSSLFYTNVSFWIWKLINWACPDIPAYVHPSINLFGIPRMYMASAERGIDCISHMNKKYVPGRINGKYSLEAQTIKIARGNEMVSYWVHWYLTYSNCCGWVYCISTSNRSLGFFGIGLAL